jgi:hypothetical protein
MTEGDFETVREPRESNFQMGVFRGKMLESLDASLDDRGLQSSDRLALEAGSIRQKAGYASRRRCQPGIGVNAHVQVFWFSGHG